MAVKCILCGSNDVTLANEVKTAEIASIYIHLFAIEVDRFFKGFETIGFYKCNACDLCFFSPAVIGDEVFYDSLQEFDWYYSKEKPEFLSALQYIKGGDRVLEVGCGSGQFGRLVQDCEYVGLELNRKALSSAIQNFQQVLVQTIEDHAEQNGGIYDVVCAFQVLEHVLDPGSFIRSCVNCLKQGGLLILSLPSENSYLGFVEDGILNMPPHHITRWTDDALKLMARSNNLELVCFEHELLSDVHLKAYATESIRRTIKEIFGIPHTLASTALSHRMLTFFCQLAGTINVKVIKGRNSRPFGHSVTMVSRKVAPV